MSAGLFHHAIQEALSAIGALAENSHVALLLAWPSQDLAQDELPTASPDLGNGLIPFGGWQSGYEAGVYFISNVAPISFGAINGDVIDVVGWVLNTDYGPIAWGPLVDSTGAQITRSFYAGDEVTFPAGALRIGLA